MAFINDSGQSISYDCADLIAELKEDIAEFGSDTILEVVTEQRDGITIYKDYNFISGGDGNNFDLSEGEKVQKISASALLHLYETENSIL